MDQRCKWFQNIMPDFEAGRLSTADHRAAHEHLIACFDCLGAWSTRTDDELDISQQVMSHTQSDPCAGAADRMAAYSDGELETDERDLMNLHISNCDPCETLLSTMARLSQELPDLAYMTPDEDFTRDVLAATLPQPAGKGLWDRFRDTWLDLVKRPRFALEAAYVLSVILFFILRLAPNTEPTLDAINQAGVKLTAGLNQATIQLDTRVNRAGDHLYQDFNSAVTETGRNLQGAMKSATKIQTPILNGLKKIEPAKQAGDQFPWWPWSTEQDTTHKKRSES